MSFHKVSSIKVDHSSKFATTKTPSSSTFHSRVPSSFFMIMIRYLSSSIGILVLKSSPSLFYFPIHYFSSRQTLFFFSLDRYFFLDIFFSFLIAIIHLATSIRSQYGHGFSQFRVLKSWGCWPCLNSGPTRKFTILIKGVYEFIINLTLNF